MSIGVLGGGAWGTALAANLASKHDDVLLWARDADTVANIRAMGENRRRLPGISLPPALKTTADLARTAACDIVLCVVPAQRLGEILADAAPHFGDAASLVLCCKGIDQASGHLPHELAGQTLGGVQIAALSGPSFARDVAQSKPTAVALAAGDMYVALSLAETLSTASLRIYASDDLTGVELGGALKNVLAIAVGVARGLALGSSAEAALITRGFAELRAIGIAAGGRAETFSGLSGMGDLVLTCSSPQSRNFAYGTALARGEDLDDLPLAEGVHTAQMAAVLARDSGVEAPIIDAVCALLDGRLTPMDAVRRLLSRPLKTEIQ